MNCGLNVYPDTMVNHCLRKQSCHISTFLILALQQIFQFLATVRPTIIIKKIYDFFRPLIQKQNWVCIL